MPLNRRALLKLAAAGFATSLLRPSLASASAPIQAVAFDAFPIFDPRPIAARCEALYPGQGAALVALWRTKQFEYQWLRALSGSYVDFWQATEDGLTFSASALGLSLSPTQREQLMEGYLSLRAWPDAHAALQALRDMGLRLALLSNATSAILHAGLQHSGLTDLIDPVLSTDAVKTYKPDPRAYALGTQALSLPREAILFVAFAGWDVAGAKAFGYKTFWVNRLGAPPEQLGQRADGEGPDLPALVAFIKSNALASPKISSPDP